MPLAIGNCPIEGCPNLKPLQHAMCGTHWKMVPHDLARAVYRAYRDRNRPGGLARHLQALEDAIACIEGREPEELFS